MSGDFSILQQQSATVDSLVGCYRDFADDLEFVRAAIKETRAKQIRHVQEAAGAEDTKKVRMGQQKLDGLYLRRDAIRDTMDRIRARIIEQIPNEAQHRVAAIDDEFAGLREEQRVVEQQILKAAAHLAALYESLHGTPASVDSNGKWRSSFDHITIGSNGASIPEPGTPTGEYIELLKAERKKIGADTVKTRQDRLRSERGKLEKLLSHDPETTADKLLGPEKSAEEQPQQQESRYKSSSIEYRETPDNGYADPPLQPVEHRSAVMYPEAQ